MHYYKFNIGSYRRRTSHLTLLEHGIYRMLIDTYYLDEKPLDLDLAKVMRKHSIRTEDEKDSLINILEDFFIETPDGYINKNCDKEIGTYHSKSDKARESANKRWRKDEKPSTELAIVAPAKKPKKRFIAPSAAEVAQYAVDKQLHLVGFHDYYESNGWQVGKSKMKNWQASARGWSGRQDRFSKPKNELNMDSTGWAG